jgi:very-short-patch-repair endonuclease
MNKRITHNERARKNARRTLRAYGTPSEAAMWLMLKGKQVRGLQFRRQFSVGPYILDFYCPLVKLCIELDGMPHFTPEGEVYDMRRTEYLERYHQIKVLRFENQAVFDYPEGVLGEIERNIDEIRGMVGEKG